jgi:hypothetical protein
MQRSIFQLYAVLLAAALAVLPAYAQTHTVSIQNGEVRVDGRLQRAEDIPASLDVDGVVAQLSFTGAATPFFELNGYYYTIDGGRLREVAADEMAEGRTEVVFRGQSRSATGTSAYGDMPAPQEAAENSLMQLYFQDVQREDDALYRRLVNEFDLENETLQRAQRIRGMSPGSERDREIEELRKRLELIFELKQENRRMEIEQLEEQLGELQRRLAEREELKKRIIDQRLRELIQ